MRLRFFTLLTICSLSFSIKGESATWGEILSGCMLGFGGGVAGTALSQSALPAGSAMITGPAMLIAGAITCLGGMAYVSMSSEAEINRLEFELKRENERLGFENKRLNREKCLRTQSCKPGSAGTLVEGDYGLTKQGDKVFAGHAVTIEANDEDD